MSGASGHPTLLNKPKRDADLSTADQHH